MQDDICAKFSVNVRMKSGRYNQKSRICKNKNSIIRKGDLLYSRRVAFTEVYAGL